MILSAIVDNKIFGPVKIHKCVKIVSGTYCEMINNRIFDVIKRRASHIDN